MLTLMCKNVEVQNNNIIILIHELTDLGKVSKKDFKKRDNYHFLWGGVSEGHLSLFFGLKMIFKQF